MMWNEQTSEEARRLVEALTEKQWKIVCEVMISLAKPKSDEEKAKQKELQEKQAQAMAERRADFAMKKFTFNNMRNSLGEGVVVPERYEWSIADISEAFAMAFHPLAGHDEVYDLADYMFNLGFKRGMSFQQSKAAKKANANLKKALHPSRRNDTAQALIQAGQMLSQEGHV